MVRGPCLLYTVSPRVVENLDPAATVGSLGQSPQFDPFHRRQVDEDGMVVEVDRSDEVLAALQRLGQGGPDTPACH